MTWTTDDGQQREYVFAIRGHVRSALRLSPDELSFGRLDITRGVRKHVECTSDLPLDWHAAAVTVEAAYLQVEHQRAAADGQRLLFDVVCRPSGTGDSRQAVIQLRVDGWSLDDSPQPQAFSAQLPVYAADSTPLSIAPRIAGLRSKSAGAPWVGQLIVTGDAVAAGAEIRQIRCPNGRIEYHSNAHRPRSPAS